MNFLTFWSDEHRIVFSHVLFSVSDRCFANEPVMVKRSILSASPSDPVAFFFFFLILDTLHQGCLWPSSSSSFPLFFPLLCLYLWMQTEEMYSLKGRMCSDVIWLTMQIFADCNVYTNASESKEDLLLCPGSTISGWPRAFLAFHPAVLVFIIIIHRSFNLQECEKCLSAFFLNI